MCVRVCACVRVHVRVYVCQRAYACKLFKTSAPCKIRNEFKLLLCFEITTLQSYRSKWLRG